MKIVRALGRRALVVGWYLRVFVAFIDSIRIKVNPMSWFYARSCGVLNLFYAILVIIGGRQKWSLQTYYILAQLPGAPYSWAWILTAASLMSFFGIVAQRSTVFYRIRNLGFILLTIWWAIFDICIWLAITPNNSVPYAAGIAALFPAVMALGMYPVDERVRIDDAQVFARPLATVVPPDLPPVRLGE